MEDEPNSDTLEGTTEPTVVDAGTVFVNTGPEFPVQKNPAAKAIGILVIIYYVVLTGLNFLGLVALSFCLLYTSPSPRDRTRSRMPSSA